MGWEVIKDHYAKLVLQAYTKAQLLKIIEFYETPAGKVYAERSPWLSRELTKLIIRNLQQQ
jgi:hypothetical protein